MYGTSAATNTTSLFTQVGSVDQAGSDSFFIANVSANRHDYAILLDPADGDTHMAYNRSKVGVPSAAANWHPSSPPPPGPGPGPSRNVSWDCYTGEDNHDALVKPPYNLRDHDVASGVGDLEACQGMCAASRQCMVAVWHANDAHCHTLTGAVTQAEFVHTLQPVKDSVACFNTQGARPAPSPLVPYGPGTLPIKPLGSWMVIGDWGGEEAAPFVMSGQVELAKQMGHFAANATSWSPVSDFVGLGDNFYTCGINCGIKSGPHAGTCDRFTTKVPHMPNCSPDESNFRFRDVFEDVYAAPSLQNLTFRVISGNHDHHGNVSAQIAYVTCSSPPLHCERGDTSTLCACAPGKL